MWTTGLGWGAGLRHRDAPVAVKTRGNLCNTAVMCHASIANAVWAIPGITQRSEWGASCRQGMVGQQSFLDKLSTCCFSALHLAFRLNRPIVQLRVAM